MHADQGKRIAQAIELLLAEGQGPAAPPAAAAKPLRGTLIKEGVAPPAAKPRKVKG